MSFSIIIPAKNEAGGLAKVLPDIKSRYPQAEIIVSDDGSTDATADVARQHGALVVSSPYSMGNGAAIKRGVRAASQDILVMMDGDGQHQPCEIQRLLDALDEGYDMIVGYRSSEGQANVGRGLANGLYNRLASLITGHKIHDLTSGFRAVRAEKFREFLYLLPNGFSYPTTSTMAFFRSAYTVGYVPVEVLARIGSSHIKPLRDGIRFLLIIFKIATLYSPLKIFASVAFSLFSLGGVYYVFTYLESHRFTNMSALLFSASVVVFMIGLISEQITSLIYKSNH